MLFLLLSSFTFSAFGQSSIIRWGTTSQTDLSAMMQPVPQKYAFRDSLYNIWCGSVIKGKKGKFYMFYSRWPREKGHEAWITHSEIALARADRPEGPYRHVKVVLPALGNEFWDGVCTHNPAVIAYKNKFYLYYMGSTGKSYVKPHTSYENPNWWEYRNNQRIGVAVADDPEGEWTRFEKPLLDVSADSAAYDALMVSNPAITVDDNGQFILVYKQVEKNGTISGGKVRFGVAFSFAPTGPFAKHAQPIFEAEKGSKERMVAEDPFLWHQKGINYAIIRDVVGKFTGEGGALALMISTNGFEWHPALYPKVLSKTIFWDNGKPLDDKLERPCLYMEKGVPKLLFGAMGIDKRKHSMNVAVPLKYNMK